MSSFLLDQLHFIRKNTLKLVSGLSEEQSEIIPEGLNNHIKWNLGHIYFVHERNAFYFLKEDWIMPESYPSLFGPGTKPENGQRMEVELSEIVSLLENQIDRFEARLKNRMQEKTPESYTTSTGMHMTTIEEFMGCNLYHEGMHKEKISVIKQLINSSLN